MQAEVVEVVKLKTERNGEECRGMERSGGGWR
jgi:hypothetical protein